MKSKIKIIQLILILFLGSYRVSIAQDNMQLRIDDALVDEDPWTTLNYGKISTGILYDKVFPTTPLQNFTGITDSVSNFNVWKQIYNEMYRGQLTSYALAPTDSLNTKFRNYILINSVYPIAILDIKYNQIKEYAFSNNLLKIVNRKFADVTGASESPYYERRVVSVAIPVERIRKTNAVFTFRREFFYSNYASFPSSIQVDFGDGKGFQTLVENQKVTVNFNSNSFSTTKYLLKVRINYSSQTVKAQTTTHPFECYSNINPDLPPWPSSPIPPIQVAPHMIKASIPFNNSYAYGNAYVWYRANVSSGEQGKIKKPVIVVEGIDFGKNNRDNIDYNQLGWLGWCQLWGGDLRKLEGFPEMEKMPILLNELHQKGYDVIMLDFFDGADYIQKNAMLLVELIKLVNNPLYRVGTEQNIIIGASMGGQVAKYALSYMEANNIKHCVSEYISFDSPHRGANIPLGLQFLVKFMAEKKDDQTAQESLNEKLNRPAAAQLLNYHYNPSNIPIINQWRADVGNLGYPKMLRKVGVANGSGIASQFFSAGGQLIDYKVSLVVANFRIRAWSIPGVSISNINNTIFFGKLPWKKPVFNVTSPSAAQYDNCPGGGRNTAEVIAAADPSIPVHPGTIWSDWLKISKIKAGNITTSNPNQCFIPIISALDINTSNVYYNVSTSITSNPNLTPFEDIYVAPSANEMHVQATGNTASGNIKWVLDELGKNANNLQASLNSSSPNAGVFNYARKESRFLNKVIIGNGGKLHVNANLPSDYGAATTPLPPGGTPAPGTGKAYTLETCYCDPIIEVQSNGQFIIGDAAANNSATVIFHKGSTLRIINGGRLAINNNSKLIIEPGAKLIYEAGAQIQLLGDNAVLEIQGQLHIGPSATFTFTYPNNNSGYVKFSGYGYFPSKNITSEGYANILFNGQGQNDKVLEITQETLYIPEEIGNYFRLLNGTAALGPDSRLSVPTKTLIQNAKITSLGSPNNHRGLVVFGQAIVDINNSIFENGAKGIEANLFYGGSPLNLNSVTIRNCENGLLSTGKGLNLYDVHFDNNRKAGWVINGLEFPTSVTNSSMNSNTYGIDAMNGISNSLSITRSNFNSNIISGIMVNGGDLVVQCGQVKNNGIGQVGGCGVLAAYGSLNMSTDDAGGYVDASGNALTVSLRYTKDIWLNNGNNNLEPAGAYDEVSQTGPVVIKGNMMKIPMAYLTSTNRWNKYGRTPKDQEYDITSVMGGGRFYLYDDNPLASFSPCRSRSIPSVSTPSPSVRNVRTINTADFKNTKLDDAVRIAISKIDTTLSCKKSIDLFNQILTYPLSKPNAEEQEELKKAYDKMMKAIFTLGYTNSKPNKAGLLQFTDIKKVIDVQTNLLIKNELTPTEDSRLLILLGKAQVLRLANKREEALAVLTAATFGSNMDLKADIQKWKCLMEAEQMVLNGKVAKEDFSTLIDACLFSTRSETSSERQIIQSAHTSSHGEKLAVFPNPTTGKFTIEFNVSKSGTVKIAIFDITGKNVLTIPDNKSYNEGNHKMEVDAAPLGNGIYFIHLNTEEGNIIKKMSVIK